MQTKERILVTGATGLVGSHLLHQLASSEAEITALCRTPPQNADSRYRWLACDILDVPTLYQAMQHIDKVYHCAAIVSFDPDKKKELLQINVEGTANVVNAAIACGVKKLLHVSSVAAIGEANKQTDFIHEKLEWKKERASTYGLSKHLAEMEVWRGVAEGLNAVIINPSVILGCADWHKGSAEIFKTVYNEFAWYTNGIHGFVDVADVVKAAILLMNSELSAERFIVNGINISYKDLLIKIAQAFHKKPPHKVVSKWMSEIIWRLSAVKSMFTGGSSILTKRSARTAMAKIEYSSEKLNSFFPDFTYTNIDMSILRICKELEEKYKLPSKF